jgi:hypothetical protein
METPRSIADLKAKELVFFEVISGSRAYGLDTPSSDWDIHGLYILPLEERLRYEPAYQINSEKNDHMYWELSKFLRLLQVANPGALEMLYTPQKCILQQDSGLMDLLRGMPFLTKKCQGSFVRYAEAQLKKARGLNKKIFNPQPEERLKIMDFCTIHDDGKTMPLRKWLERRGYSYKHCALTVLDKMPGAFALYYQGEIPSDEERFAFGVVRDDATSNDIQLASIPKGKSPCAVMGFSLDVFKKHCRDHKDYWDWVKERNDVRYEGTLKHGGGYDAKNMMHVFRLLHTAKDIACGRGLQVDRTFEREFLLDIKSGKYSYDELMPRAMALIQEVDSLFMHSDLPEEAPDVEEILLSVLRVRYGLLKS